MKIAISHETTYRYDAPAAHSTQYLRLTPRNSAHQKILEWKLDLPVKAHGSTDAFGNILHVLTLDKPHEAIHLRATGVVETCEEGWQEEDEFLSPLIFLRATDLTRADSAIHAFAQRFAHAVAANPCQGLNDLMEALADAVVYQRGMTDARTTATTAFSQGAGVCQDHAHIFISACQSLGIPARYVSGYLLTDESSHVASHAWAEAWVDGAWQGFDISNRCRPHSHHLKLAVGFDYMDACPVRGVRRGGSGETLDARAAVRIVEE